MGNLRREKTKNLISFFLQYVIVIYRVNVFVINLHAAWDRGDDEDDDRRRGGGYVKTHNKHKSSFNMAHEHERGRETVRRFKRQF